MVAVGLDDVVVLGFGVLGEAERGRAEVAEVDEQRAVRYRIGAVRSLERVHVVQEREHELE